MIDNSKLLIIFERSKFKRINQSYSPFKINQSILNDALLTKATNISKFLNESKITKKMNECKEKFRSFNKSANVLFERKMRKV